MMIEYMRGKNACYKKKVFLRQKPISNICYCKAIEYMSFAVAVSVSSNEPAPALLARWQMTRPGLKMCRS